MSSSTPLSSALFDAVRDIGGWFYEEDAFVFEAISRRYWLDNFFTHNAWAVVKESLILGPIAAIAFLWRARLRFRRPDTT